MGVVPIRPTYINTYRNTVLHRFIEKFLKIFGLNLKIERLKLGLSQEKIAESLDFSSVYVSNVESGKHNQVSLVNAYKFASFYKKSLDYLLTEKS